MKKLCQFISIILLISVLSSCEKVIDVELEEAEKQIIIESKLQKGEHAFTVLISETAPYFDDSSPKKINDAIVSLSWGDKVIDIPLVSDGFYEANINANSGTTYKLEVHIDDEVFEASSFLPEKIDIIELYSEYTEGAGPIEEGYIVYFRYYDPAGKPNYYRTIHSVNGEAQLKGEDMQVFDDNLNDGNYAQYQLFRKVFEPGDEINLTLMHIDEDSYNFYSTLGDISGGGSGPSGGLAAPGNPISNWSNGALGYFSAYSSDTKSITIPPLPN